MSVKKLIRYIIHIHCVEKLKISRKLTVWKWINYSQYCIIYQYNRTLGYNQYKIGKLAKSQNIFIAFEFWIVYLQNVKRKETNIFQDIILIAKFSLWLIRIIQLKFGVRFNCSRLNQLVSFHLYIGTWYVIRKT